MKKNRKILALVLAVIAILAMIASCGKKTASDDKGASSEEKFTIGIVQIADHPALNSARDGFKDELSKLGINFETIEENAQGDPSNLKAITESFNSKKVDLILAIATDSAISAAGATEESNIPILGTAITDYASVNLVDSNEKPGGNISGTSDMNPIKEQIELIEEAVPDMKKLGMIYASNQVNSEVQIKIAEEILKEKGIAYEIATVSSVNDIQQVAGSLSNNVEAILVPTDNVIAAAIPNLVSITEPLGIVVLGGEPGQVVSGATLTLGINYYELGKQTAQMAKRVLVDGEDISTMPIETQKVFDYVYNKNAVDAIGLTLPESFLAKARDVSESQVDNSGANENETTAQDSEFNIGIIQIVDHGSLNAAREGFVAQLESKGLKINVDYQNANGDPNTLKTISQSFAVKDLDLVLAVATNSAVSAAAEISDVPILGTAITDYVGEKLVASNDAPGGNVSGTSDYNPEAIKGQIGLIPVLRPDVKTVGIMYSSNEPNSLLQAEAAKKELDALGLAYIESTVSSVNDIQQAAASLAGKVEAVFVPTDNNIASAIPNLVSITDEEGILTIVGAADMARDGATATLGLDYFALGQMTGDMAYEILVNGADVSTMPIQTIDIDDYTFVFNEYSVGALGIDIPKNLMDKAE